jgi:hypothetical protein
VELTLPQNGLIAGAQVRALVKIWRGEVPLAQAFWLWGVVVLVALTVGGQYAIFHLAMAGVGGILFFGFLFAACVLIYQVAVSVGVWRSAGHYSGPWVWVLLARLAAVLSLGSMTLGAVSIALLSQNDTHDRSSNSANVATTLVPSTEYPLTGFWKNSCTENFGLAIKPAAEPRIYSVTFCGPGGCFKPGTYRPNTAIVDDPAYRVIDQETIEVEGHDGFSRYVRCQ